jgi:hypothetical protein
MLYNIKNNFNWLTKKLTLKNEAYKNSPVMPPRVAGSSPSLGTITFSFVKERVLRINVAFYEEIGR